MTKKDYELIASALYISKPCHYTHDNIEKEAIQAWKTTCIIVSNKLEGENIRFDRQKFLTACGAE